jgi:hypothetical protein
VQLKKLNVSVVVLANIHNPSILHPAFLGSQGIIPPKGFELAEPPICTPPFSVVKYRNGITFTVESTKLQVLQAPPPPELKDSPVPELAANYISKLPHVRYTAVGINISVFLKHPEPEKFLIERFLVASNCNVDSLLLRSTSLRFVYSVNGYSLSLSFDPGSSVYEESSGPSKGIIVNANYHMEFTANDALRKATDAITDFRKRCEHFERVVITNLDRLEET